MAYTRAKKKLGFISEQEIKPFGVSQGPDIILKELGLIENLICRVLGKEPTEQKESVDVSRFNLKNGITQIDDEHKDDNFKTIETNKVNEDNNLLQELDDLLNL